MKIIVSSTNMQISESMKELSEMKLAKLARYLSKYDSEEVLAKVILESAPNEKFIAKIDLDVNGTVYNSKSNEFELETALIEAVSQLERQYEKDKEAIELRWKEKRAAKESATELATEL